MKLVSECCGAKPWNETDENLHGHCSECGDLAVFYDEDDSREDDLTNSWLSWAIANSYIEK